jgi:hypothetical protein
MKPIDRKAAVSAYKEQKTSAGVCAVRCTADGREWLMESRTLDTFQNRLWFELRTGGHRDRTLQAAWTAHGEGAFSFEVLERLPEDTSPLLLRAEMKKRLAHWTAQRAAQTGGA